MSLFYNSRGISVHDFEFGCAGSLLARRMGWLGAELRRVLARARAGGLRCHSSVIVVRDVVEWRGAGEVAQRFVEIWRKLASRVLDTGRRRSAFGARRREANVRSMGGVRDGGQMNKTA